MASGGSDSSDVLTEAERRYQERFPGWRRSDAEPCCPRVVAGKRCLVLHGSAPGPGAPPRRRCACEARHGRRALDHGRLWVTEDGERVLTGEPYGPLDGETLRRFVADCHDLGLGVQVSPRSPWNPGSTLLLVVHKAAGEAEGEGRADE